MKKNAENKLDLERTRQLFKTRSEILCLPPDKRLDRILEHPQPAALVHSFPEEDLHFLIHDIGLQDSLPLLALASDKQKEFILDVETWEKDRIDLGAVTKWLDLMLQTDPIRLIRWLSDQKPEFLEFYLNDNIDIQIREHDQDPSDFGDEYFTNDEIIYIRIIDKPSFPETREISERHRKDFLKRFLNKLSDFDFHAYRNFLVESTSIIQAETEEEIYRLRNIRLAEKGFFPFDEAVGIYQPLKSGDLKAKSPKTEWLLDQAVLLPAPLYYTGMLEPNNLFTRALLHIKDDDILQRLQVEFATLANQIAAADQKIIHNKEELRDIVKKAGSYLNIGLEKLTAEKDAGEKGVMASTGFIQQYPLPDIFRVGFGQALALKWRADKWKKTSWFSQQGLAISFWGELWLGVLEGLFIKKPLYFDNYETTDQLYREFSSLQDIQDTETALDEVVEVDGLLSHLNIRIESAFEGFLTFKNLLLTLWARDCLGLKVELKPIQLANFKNFFEYLFSNEPSVKKKADSHRKIGQPVKESFLSWVSRQTGLPDHDISVKLGQALENLFNEIEAEYGNVSPKDLDPRHVYHFLLEE